MSLDEAGEGLLNVVEVDHNVVNEVDADVVAVCVPRLGANDLEGVHDVGHKSVALGDEVLGRSH